jgi:hypothetical protein
VPSNAYLHPSLPPWVAESQRTPVFYPLVALYDLSGAVAPTAVDVGKLKEKLRKVMNAFAIEPF